MSVKYRLFDINKENPQNIFDLFEATYGSSEPIKMRWHWQYANHPRREEIKVVIAEDGERIAGMTAHLPSDFILDGEKFTGFYASDSMVHPAYRRRGIMKCIYENCMEMMPILYAKGTNPEMYKFRIGIGFKPVIPNSYFVNMISPIRWFFMKLKSGEKGEVPVRKELSTAYGFQPVEHFRVEFDNFWNRAASGYGGIIARDADYMNWRYLAHPYKKYRAFYRKKNDEIISVVVFRIVRQTAYIVDILWDREEEGSLSNLLKCTRKYFKKLGIIKFYCWVTLRQLRHSLRSSGSIDIKTTPRLTVFSKSDLIDRLADGNNIHFVDGDGDNEFL